MKIFLISITFIFFSATGIANENKIIDGQLHEVKPKKGDGVFTILKRYELLHDPIYEEAFKRLNKLNQNSVLYNYKSYKLPIFLYNYDGKSIRSTIGINDWDKAVRIKNYNEKLLAKKARQTHYTNSKILWVPFAEINDVPAPDRSLASDAKNDSTAPATNTPVKPAIKKKKKESGKADVASVSMDIYGKKYATFKMVDNSLSDKVYYIVSGHGGPDPGAVCKDCPSRLCEDEYAYDVSLRLARNLMQHGAKVEIVIQDPNDGIRDARILKCDGDDETLADGSSIPVGHLERLQQRTFYINKKFKQYRNSGYRDQYVVSIHIDSNNESHKQDVFFCYYKNSESSKALANRLKDKFEEKYRIHQRNKEYKGYLKKRNLYVLKYTAPPAVLVELANIRNKHNHKRILSEENRQALANWLYEGLAFPQKSLASSVR